MKTPGFFSRTLSSERAQTLPLFVIMVVVLIVFVGLVIDLGFAYQTRISLSKAVDAAALAGVRHYSRGETAAKTIARNTFDINYKSSNAIGRQSQDPIVTLEFARAADKVLLNVDASVPINTFFLRIFPQWKTMDVSAHSSSALVQAVIGLVLDRSGSMNDKGGTVTVSGSEALLPAVTNFLSFFSDNLDHAGLVSYSTTANVDVEMSQPFRTKIANLLSLFNFEGGTLMSVGLTNGFQQIKNFPYSPTEVVKICVLFTDGRANLFQTKINCKTGDKVFNVGGYDDVPFVSFFDPTNGLVHARIPSGGTLNNSAFCPGTIATYTSGIDGLPKAFTVDNLSADAEYQALQIANAMRAAHIIVYTVGLGSDINQDFLALLANDPGFPDVVATPYDGEFLYAPTADDLLGIFESLANKILLRLTR